MNGSDLPPAMSRAVGRTRRLAIAAIWGTALFLTGAGLYALRYHDKLIDFTVFQQAGHRFLLAEPLYQPEDGHYQFKYPPMSAALLAPLGAMPIGAARFLWFVAVVGSLAGLVVFSARLIGHESRVGFGVIAVTLLVLLRFYARELDLGQSNAVMAALAVAGVWFSTRGSDTRAGILLGVAAALKPYAIVLLLPFLGRGRLRLCISALSILVLLSLAAVFRYGWDDHAQLLNACALTLAQSSTALLTNPDNVSFFGAWAKWLGAESSASLGLISVAVSLTALGYAAWRAQKQIPGSRTNSLLVEVGALLVLIPLLSPQGWDYTFLVATPAIMLLLARRTRFPKLARAVLYLGLAVIGGAYFDLLGRGRYHEFMNASVITVAFAVVFAFVVALRLRDTDPVPQSDSR